jgi:5-methylcytosine-specific restriction endonuclease McrA
MRVNGGSCSPTQWKQVRRAYGNRCVRCGHRIKLTMDHVRPVALGGASDAANLQPLCEACNGWKGARWIDFRPDGGAAARRIAYAGA